jgi:hypothetical protein
MHRNDTTTRQRRQHDRFQPPKTPLEWEGEVRLRRADDFIPPDRPLDWSDLDQPEVQTESKN